MRSAPLCRAVLQDEAVLSYGIARWESKRRGRGQQQVVLKSLEANFRRIEGIAATTILGDGRVALILDVTGLIKLLGGAPGSLARPMTNSGPSPRGCEVKA
jgi:hypothetical protein